MLGIEGIEPVEFRSGVLNAEAPVGGGSGDVSLRDRGLDLPPQGRFSVLSRSCLKQRLPDEEALGRKSRRWCRSATPPELVSTGGSKPKTPAPNFTAFTLLIPKLTDY